VKYYTTSGVDYFQIEVVSSEIGILIEDGISTLNPLFAPCQLADTSSPATIVSD
jgi:hypothetical protein